MRHGCYPIKPGYCTSSRFTPLESNRTGVSSGTSAMCRCATSQSRKIVSIAAARPAGGGERPGSVMYAASPA